MPPYGFQFFHKIFHHLQIFLLFNLFDDHEDGLTFYDLQQIEGLPASKIYRLMKKLEEEGYLIHEEPLNELGRPKYVFKKSPRGNERHKELKAELKQLFQVIQTSNFPSNSEFNIDEFLEKATFQLFPAPYKRILSCNISTSEKLARLREMEQEMTDSLAEIRKSIDFFEQQINHEEKLHENRTFND